MHALLTVIALLALPPAVQATMDHERGQAKPNAAERAQRWRATLARPPLAVTAAFDREGRWWRLIVHDRFLYASHSSDKGRTFSAGVRINREPEHIAGDGEDRPKLAFGPQGDIYVSYTRALDQPMTGDICFSRSTDGGKSFAAPITVNDNREIISHRFAALSVGPDGRVVLTWLDKRDLETARARGERYAGAALYYAVSTDRGATFSRNQKLADHTCECCRVAMASDIDGTPVVVWRHVFDGNVRDHALARIDAQAKPARITHDDWVVNACPHHGPAVSIAADGGYHITWFTHAPGRTGLYYSRSRDRGATWSAPMAVGAASRQASHPHVLSLGHAVFLAWKTFDGNESGVQFMHSDDGGATWSTPARVAATRDASDHPFVIGDGAVAYLSWNTLAEGHRVIELRRAAGTP